MSAPDEAASKNTGVKTLAIRLEPEMHAQLTLIAGLRGSTVTDEFRGALVAHIAAAKQAPELANKADTALADIEREAALRRDAIASLFGAEQPPATGSRSRPTRKGAGDSSPDES
ncbi:hypothetical protein FK531_07550 [Rhodococcus spelaei]|uniref:Uncharacterized protein n=1 Tax=Rhodococcus spelaei TaxID=2546320 RepID=A0A541BM21_9NOCA|nr:hypothetical protein [Rhodococcus spelaei]TQF73359.1 hypothetical protein FK531_07550 [Rhodococcus spelaei]